MSQPVDVRIFLMLAQLFIQSLSAYASKATSTTGVILTIVSPLALIIFNLAMLELLRSFRLLSAQLQMYR